MGIPSFFRKIVKEYQGVTFWDPNKVIDHFFIDFNAMIYNVMRQIDNSDKMNAFEYENVLLTKTLEQMERVIGEIVKPQKSLIIGMDGPPPRAKMIQQRHRRYKGVKEAEFHAEIEKKYQKNIKRLNWNKSAISPGTVFMSRLSKRIVHYIENGKFSKHLNGKLSITFSDASVPGEGEHKILPALHELKSNHPDDVVAIYSPDADMIVLSQITHKSEIYIFKENDEFKHIVDPLTGIKSEFLYLSIDRCRQGFLSELYETYPLVKNELNEKLTPEELCDRFLIDYSFLTFLCGNDFVIASPFLKMKEGGMDTLLTIYNQIFEGVYLVDHEFNINAPFFIRVISKLRELELPQLQSTQRKRDRIRRGNVSNNSNNSNNDNRSKKDKRLDLKDVEPWKDEMSRFEHEYYYSPDHPQFELYNKEFFKLDYYKDNWKDRYNKHFFGEKCSIDDICKNYIKSLKFCLEYYLKGIPSWTWFYPFRAAPLFCDLEDWLVGTEFPRFTFEKGEPFTPFEQLLLVLPKLSFGLLPKPLRDIPFKLEQISFPRHFELDILLGGKYIYSEPILPEIDTEQIRNFVASVSLSENEQIRNTVNYKPMKIVK